MKCEREGRRLIFTDLPAKVDGIRIPDRVVVDLEYRLCDGSERGALRNAIALYELIAPAIEQAINATQAMIDRGRSPQDRS